MPPDTHARFWNEAIELMPRERMRGLQLARLKKQVAYNFANSEFYRSKFEAVGMQPGDIKSFEDFSRLPPMTKDQHRAAQANPSSVTAIRYAFSTVPKSTRWCASTARREPPGCRRFTR